MTFEIRPATGADRDGVVVLHKAAAVTPGALARAPEEVTLAYGDYAIASDICLVAVEADATVVGEIHASRETVALFAHVLGGLTVAVHPERQGRGIGSKLFKALIAWARTQDPAILRIELAAGAGNPGAIRLYERLGFKHEGRQVARGRLPDGRFEDDILMGMLL
ncbi:GNAT family N-acetyltransferase [Caulobacter sp. RL271]|uniref:GNAT family N-acetyltransferase n=1 Tax=Caulobacter segnis TaxID=88688 RepID=A0ABY4ZN68_9CAUL|nr:GNAT family N-acetyltransferase [Caulobacter segnis]USQ94000.1 GNAT family N-acetyltransferase [Caulobacter segnis]